jgi:imidazole glycerol phosphate synthase glutamine amidotransferase subunit
MTEEIMSIEVIDAAGGNIGSLCRALERLGVDYELVNGQSLPTGRKPLILPGVGNFGAVMNRLRDARLDQRIVDIAGQGVPFLGICVGLQVLFEGSEESPGVPGLKLLEGKVVKFRDGKVPQIGWNSVTSNSPDWQSGFVYFVNSYFAAPTQPDMVLYQSEYFKPFCAAVKKDNITAFQFHPEKSGPFGIGLLKHWLDDALLWTKEQSLVDSGRRSTGVNEVKGQKQAQRENNAAC